MTTNEPIRVLMLFTILNRGGAESMVMNYYREIDRTKVQFDFVVHREEKGDFEDEITALGGKVYRRYRPSSMSTPNTRLSMGNARSRAISSIKKQPSGASPSSSPMHTIAM